MKIHADPTTDGTSIALDVDHPGTIQILDAAFIPCGTLVMTPTEAAELRDELTRALDDIQRKTDSASPYCDKILTIGLAGTAFVGDIELWRAEIRGLAHPAADALWDMLRTVHPRTVYGVAKIAAVVDFVATLERHPFTLDLDDATPKTTEPA